MKKSITCKIQCLLAIISLIVPSLAIAQAPPVLELDFLSAAPPVGPNTNPITVPFSLDTINNNSYIPMNNPLMITLSLQDQAFTNLTYSNISDGLVFGGGSNLSSGGVVQQSSVNVPYDLFGTYGSNGGPKSEMFTTNPLATGAALGSGMDIDGNLFAPNQNGAFQLFTAAQVLYDANVAKNARVYFGELKISFSSPVKDPVIHLAGLGGSYSFLPFGSINIASNYLSTFFSTELELVNTDLSSKILSSNGLMTLVGNNLYNNYTKPNGNSTQILGEYPIDNYGAMSGSVLLTGTVKDVVYKIYLKGSSNSDINWSTDGYNPALPQPQLVTGATRDPFTGDIWWVSASLLNPTQQISGNVFVDADGLINNNITTTGSADNPKTNISGALFANLLDTNDLVIATLPISSGGTFLFDSVAPGTYKVLISAVNGTIGSVNTNTTLPPNWINTGEKTGLTPGDDGLVNGISLPVTVNLEDRITEVNFGIEQIPNSDPKTQIIPSPLVGVIPQSTATNVVSGLDAEDGILGNTQTITIQKLPTNGNLFYNNNPVLLGTILNNFDPALLSYSGITSGSTNIVFEYAFTDRANKIDPTPAVYELKWSTPLTINAIKLVGYKDKLSNELSWEIIRTLSELDYLEIYRSKNGNINELLAKIEITGKDYFYSDLDIVEGTIMNYFIATIDKLGKKEISNIVSLKRSQANDVQIYPNPVEDLFTIDFETETLSNSTATIVDVTGKIVMRVELSSGTTRSQIDITNLASGVYTLNVEREEFGTKSIQLIKK
jgi:Secretion system C-terminal sorting domain